MPTGYTSQIADGITFRKFILDCARAFGACITMRDDPSGAEIPEAFEPCNHNQEQINTAEARVKVLQSMSESECEAQAQKAYDTAIEYHNLGIQKDKALKDKYEAMLKEVDAWRPPSKDHVGLKDFMRQQITESIKFDCGLSWHEDAIKTLNPMSGEAWRASEISKERQSIASNSKYHAEEVARVSERNKWVKQLRESLVEQPAQ